MVLRKKNRDRSYKWTQTCKSNERFREAVSLKAALTGIKPLVPSGSCFTIVFFKFACKLWKAASLFATKRPHFQAHTSAAAREALFCCSHPACIYYQGTFYTHITHFTLFFPCVLKTHSWVEFVLLWLNVSGAKLSRDECCRDMYILVCPDDKLRCVCVFTPSLKGWAAAFLIEVMNPHHSDILSKCVCVCACLRCDVLTLTCWCSKGRSSARAVTVTGKYD